MKRERLILDMWVVHITDDRGRVHRCRMRGTFGWKSTYGSPVSAQLQKALKRAARTEWIIASIAFGGSLAILMFAVLPLAQQFTTWPTWGSWLIIYAAIPGLWLIFDFLLLGPYVRPAYRRDHRRIALAHNRCPWCMYDLSSQAPDSDGCTVCPECGGAWKRSEL